MTLCDSYNHRDCPKVLRPQADYIDTFFENMPRCYECCCYIYANRYAENCDLTWERMFIPLLGQEQIV